MKKVSTYKKFSCKKMTTVYNKDSRKFLLIPRDLEGGGKLILDISRWLPVQLITNNIDDIM